MASDRQTFCPQCHYPLLRLDGFEGVSSHDAPRPSGAETHDGWGWGLWAIAPDVAQAIWNGIRLAARKRKVRKLRAEILPQFPNSRICPQCLQIIRKS